MTNESLSRHNFDTHRAWRESRIAPTCVPGLPSWMWTTAMGHERLRPRHRSRSSAT